jgi:transcriptional regulator GlxA family with amidase domain
VRRIGLLLFDEVEVLDACGPFEVFSTAARFTGPQALAVCTLARDAGTVTARGGLSLGAQHGLADAPALDVVVVPGGVTAAAERDAKLIAWLARARARARAPQVPLVERRRLVE